MCVSTQQTLLHTLLLCIHMVHPTCPSLITQGPGCVKHELTSRGAAAARLVVLQVTAALTQLLGDGAHCNTHQQLFSLCYELSSVFGRCY